MPGGPQPMSQADRMALAYEITNRARELWAAERKIRIEETRNIPF